jgi:high affinity Mn2+ porin
MMNRYWLASLLVLGLSTAQAQDTSLAPTEDWNAKFQATFISQNKARFQSPYAGQNSLSSAAANSYSLTTTAYLGYRLASSASSSTELYFNPELVQGAALSNLTGLAGLSNGELQKTSGDKPTLYRARLFTRTTWGLDERMNERMALTLGNFAANDVFDQNSYAHDARTQFVNWSFLTHGAYDYAADARGYSWGASLEYIQPSWALRAGRFLQPKESNGLALNPRIFDSYGDQIEWEQSNASGGKWRALVFRNVANMGSFSDTLARSQVTGTSPVIDTIRRKQSKLGWGIAIEQPLGKNWGGFARLAAHDGKTETYAFAEIDRSFSAGLVLGGASWQRPQDQMGVALAMNGLSKSHRDYLAAGGYGFFVGDGRLNYQAERILESYYRLQWGKQQLSLGSQWISNPAYNADRGPVRMLHVRWHGEF